MYRQATLRTVLLGGSLLLCCCSAPQKREGRKPPAPGPNRLEEKKVWAADLRRMYEAADFEYGRRAVCLMAIDEGLIRRGGPVSAVDEIFGTRFARDLPVRDEQYGWGAINFAPQFEPPPGPDGRVVQAVDFVGWYLGLQYDRQGKIVEHRLSNVHKSPGIPPPEGEGRLLAAELKRLYEQAGTESERRTICLRAIDEGVIRSGGHISAVDEVLGTHFAADLPTRGEGVRNVSVSLAPPAAGPGDSAAGWFLSVVYGADGHVYGYFLSTR